MFPLKHQFGHLASESDDVHMACGVLSYCLFGRDRLLFGLYMDGTAAVRNLILWIGIVFVVSACAPTETYRIRVSATPAPTNTTDPSQAVFGGEHRMVALQMTQAPLTPSDTPTAVPSPTTIGDGRFFGPIVGDDYVSPPTSTPRPTLTPTMSLPTATPQQGTPVATAAAALPMLDPAQIGIQIDFNVDIDTWWQHLQRTRIMRMGQVKVQANWGFLQPSSPTQFDSTFRLFQAHVQRAHNDGFTTVVSIAKAPSWARNNIMGDGAPTDPQALANFITFTLERMGREIDVIEIWNEPNLRREWGYDREFSAASYMELFRAGYDAVRAYSPDILVVTAGLAPTGTTDATINDRDYLRQMYAAGLADPHYQNIAIGAHPYGWGNPPDARCCQLSDDRGWDDQPQFFFLDTLEDYREIMVANGDVNRQLYVTEFGWATWTGVPGEAPDRWMTYNTPQQQADYTLRAFEIGQSLDYVGPMILWNLNFANPTLVEQRSEIVAYSLFVSVPGLPERPLYNLLAQRP